MPVYTLSGRKYNIPDDIAKKFESDNPSATQSYHVGRNNYEIPVSKREGFLKKYPDAQPGYGEKRENFIERGMRKMKDAVAAANSAPAAPAAEEEETAMASQRTGREAAASGAEALPAGDAAGTVGAGTEAKAPAVSGGLRRPQEMMGELREKAPAFAEQVDAAGDMNLPVGIGGIPRTWQEREAAKNALGGMPGSSAESFQQKREQTDKQLTEAFKEGKFRTPEREKVQRELDAAYAERDRLQNELDNTSRDWVDASGRVHLANGADTKRREELNVQYQANQQRINELYNSPVLAKERENDPGVLGVLGNKLGAGFMKAGLGLLNGLEALAGGMTVEDASSATGYSRAPEYNPSEPNNAVARGIKAANEYAEEMSRKGEVRNGTSFTDLLLNGDIGGFLLKGLGVGAESAPMTLSAYNPYTMTLNAISMAGNNFRDNTIQNPDIPAWKRAMMSVGSAAIEQAVEKYTDPVFKYVGRGMSKEVAQKVTKEATDGIARRIAGVLKDAAGEGAEEVISNFGNDALGQALDWLNGESDYGIVAQWNDLKKRNPDAKLGDFALQKAKENLDSFFGGALAGAYTSGGAQATVGALQYAIGNKASAEQITANPETPLHPATLNIAQSFDNGYTLDNEEEKKAAVDKYSDARSRMQGVVDEETLKKIDASPTDALSNAEELGLDEEGQQALNDYVSAKAEFDGMQQRTTEEQKRSRVSSYNINGNSVEEVDGEGNVIATHEYDSPENAKVGLFVLQQTRANDDMLAERAMMILDPKYDYDAAVNAFAEQSGMDASSIEEVLSKDPLERTEPEQAMAKEFGAMIHGIIYDNSALHEEQSAEDGADVADAMGIDLNEADGVQAQEITESYTNAKNALDELFARNEALKEEVEMREQQGMPHQGIIASLDSFRPEDVQVVTDFYNQQAKFDGFANRMSSKIGEEAANRRKRHTLNGTINGQADVRNVHTITDGTNRYYLVSGNVTTDPATGMITDSDSGLIIGMDEEGNFVNIGDSSGYSVEPVTQSLDQWEEAERMRLEEEWTDKMDPNGALMPQDTTEGNAGAEAGAEGTGGDEAPAPSSVEGAAMTSQPTEQERQTAAPEAAETGPAGEAAGTVSSVESVTDENGVKRYENGVSVDEAIADMEKDELDVNEEADLAISEAQAELDKMKAPKTRAERVKNADRRKELQKTIDYYNQVKSRYGELHPTYADAAPFVQQMGQATSKKKADEILNAAIQAGVNPSEIQAVHTQKVSDIITKEEDRRKQENDVTDADRRAVMERGGTAEGRATLLDGKRGTPEKRRKLAKLIYGEYFDDDFEAVRDVKELISQWLSKGRMLDPDTFGQELGWDMGVGKDAAKVSTMFAARKQNGGDGMTFNDFVHMVWEASGGRFDTDEIRNELIGMFQGALEKSDLTEYQLKTRIAEAENRIAGEMEEAERAAGESENEAATESQQTEPLSDGGLAFGPRPEGEERPAFLGETEGETSAEEGAAEEEQEPQTDIEKEIEERHRQEYEKYIKPLLTKSDEELEQMAQKKRDAVNGDLGKLEDDLEYSAIHNVLLQREYDRQHSDVKRFIDNTIDDGDVTFVDKLSLTEFDKLKGLIDEHGTDDADGKIESYVKRLRKKYPVEKERPSGEAEGTGVQNNEEETAKEPTKKAKENQPKWQYEFHYNKETGRAWITRDNASGPVPLQDGRFYIEGKSLAELRAILENPKNNLGELLQEVEAQLHSAEISEQLRKESNPIAAIETAAQSFREEQAKKNYGADNKLVSTERYEELKKKMKQKLRGQLNVGVDPEMIAIGAEMAMYHIEAGARKFADYATRMINDLGDAIRPYLQGFYEAARRMPGMEQLRKEMDTTEAVDNFDVLNYDKQAANTVNEHKRENNEPNNSLSLQQKTEETVERKAEDADKYRAFSQVVANDMLKAMETGEKPYKSIKDIRAKAKEVGLDVDNEGRTDILLQELVEDGLVSAARQYVNTYVLQQMLSGKNAAEVRQSRDLFNDIVKLYNLQPSITQRSSNRIKMQQYSTPLPMSFVADVFAFQEGMEDVLEPTAGNGMMVFAIPESTVHANELDKTRLDNLRAQKFKKVTDQDATQPFEGEEYDAIVANPPFGGAVAKEYDGKMIPGLAEQIALNALSKMKDNGRAAIIIGGNMEYAPNGSIKTDKAFFTYLYDHYNVKGVIDMDGKLYAKQGTTYPTRMILIDGRRSEEERAQVKVYPPVLKDSPMKVKTFDELFDVAEELRNDNRKTNGNEVLRTSTGIALPDNGDTSGNTDRSGRSGQPRQNESDGRRTEREGSNGGSQKTSSQGTAQNNRRRTVGVQQPGIPGLFDTEETPSEPQSQTGASKERGGNVGDTGRVQSGNLSDTGASNSGVGLKPEEKSSGTVARQPKETPKADIQQAPAQPLKPKVVEEKRELETEKLSYRPHNTAFSLESVAPAAMVEAMDDMLKKIEKENGNIDAWVTSELGYDSIEDMHNALAAEQVDSVAMAIYQMKQGQGMIIGDQTGVGKGRQMAALIRWACKQGKKPIFITQKDDLFSDIYRDLVDIGSGDLRPFIFNAASVSTDKETGEKKHMGGVMIDGNGTLVYRSLGKQAQDKIFESGKLPSEYDYAVLTYSQVNTGDAISQEEAKATAKEKGERYQKKKKKGGEKPTPKATFLRAIANDNYLFLDESHTAAGKSNTGAYFQSILKAAKGVTFASATFAKRPDTMPMYAIRTAMSKAKVKADELIEIIENGGVTLQEIMSRALTQAGQMVRRERDMSDVKTDWKTVDDPEIVRKARENYDKTIAAFNAIIDFQRNYVSGYLDNLSGQLAEVAASAGMRQGTEDLGIKNVPFASKTYNYTKQLMLALKVDAVVDEVVKEIEAGRHPVIALENTMGGLLSEYSPGDTITDTTFAASLLKGLKGVLRYTITNEDGKQIQQELAPEQLGPEAAEAYYNVENLIRESTSGIFISPLDAIIEKLQGKGYKVGELTGRNEQAVLDENTGDYVVRRRTDKDKKKLARDFNSGALDVLILNKSASTGISLHASEKFSDQRQRTMIIAQPLADINDYMQMIGRIDRTGQVARGYYINLGLPVPAEGRFLMMLSTKLKSLNANTTTSQESESNDVEAPDLLNKYGSKVVVEYLRDNPDIYVKMGEPLKKDKGKVSVRELDEYEAQEDDARKITGYVALLPTKEQDAFYNDVVRRYNELIQYLNDTGSNDLKISVLPLRARTIDKQVSSEGADPTGTNPFAQDAYVEWVEMDVLKKPMKAAEIGKVIDQLNPEVENAPKVQAKTAAQEKALADKLTPRVRQIIDTVERETQAKLDKENERYETAKARAEEDIAAKTEAINSKDKLTAEQKQEAIDKYIADRRQSVEESHNNMVNKIDANHARLMKYLKMFQVGDSVLVPDDLTTDTFMGSSPGIFCGFKAKDEGVTPSTTLAVFATLDGRRKIEVKLSDWGSLTRINNMTMQNLDAAMNVTLSNWDSQIPAETRKQGFIMTGNILQAFADAGRDGRVPGQLVTYTDIDGEVHDGILMNQHWEPSQLKGSTVPIKNRMEEIKNLENGDHVTSADGQVVISRFYAYYTITVPKSKKLGAQYYENDRLLDLIDDRNFYPSRGQLQGDVPAEDIEKAVNVLSDLGVQMNSDTKVQFDTETEMGQAKANGTRRYDEDIDDAVKEERIEKLRNSEPAIISGNEIEITDDQKQNKRNAIEYGKTLQGEYTNADTGESIKLQRGRKNGGIKEVLQHNYKDKEHIQSIAAIPQIIEKSIYMESEENTDKETNPDVVEYRHYVCGLKIGNEDYTVHSLIAVDSRGNRYYDHNLTHIEKGKLLDHISGKAVIDGFGTTPGTKPTTERKVSKLISILQTKGQKNAQKERILNHINILSEKLGTKERTKVYRSLDEVPEDERRHIEERHRQGRKVRGWYENGEVHLFLPDIESEHQAEKTLWHETVAHHGLRQLIGDENLDRLLRHLWLEHRDGDMGAWVTKRMEQNGWRLNEAIEEYLAREAEEHPFEQPSLWQRLRWMLADVLHKMGFATDPTMSDVQYLFWVSQNRLREGDALSKIKQQAFLHRLERAAAMTPHRQTYVNMYAEKVEDIYNPEAEGAYPDGETIRHSEETGRRHDEDIEEPLEVESAKDLYNERVDTAGFIVTEAYQDSMLALKTAQNAIVKDGEIPDSQNAYMAENLMHGKNKNEQDLFNLEYRDPIIDTVNEILNKMGWTMRRMNQYLLTKSGLERNRELFVRDWLERQRKTLPHAYEDLNDDEKAIYDRKADKIETDFEDGVIDEAEKEKRLEAALVEAHQEYIDGIENEWQTLKDHLYSGLKVNLWGYLKGLDAFIEGRIDDEYDPSKNDYSGLTEIYGGQFDDEEAINDVMNDEDAMELTPDGNTSGTVNKLWDKIHAASRYGLERYREAGMRSDEEIDKIEQMFHWYVPMRGFDKDTGEDMYQYFTSAQKANSYVGGLIKRAKGRKSRSKAPLASLFAMTYKAIGDCNQNLVNQHLYRLCQAHPNDLVVLSDAWAVLNETTGLWEEAYPTIPDDASAEEIRQITLAFEDDMRRKAVEGTAKKLNGKGRIDYAPADKKKRDEHIVEVRMNGRKKRMTFVGNPRAAQALNGHTRFERNHNPISNVNNWIKNKMAGAFTSFSPTFALRNMMRDWTHFRMMLGVREGQGYAHAAHKYYKETFPRPVHTRGKEGIKSLFKKYRAGTLDMNKEVERDFKDFMDNGGITGFVQMQKIEDIEKEMEKVNKQLKDGKAVKLNSKLWDFTLGAIEAYNEAIENNARFATYRASRHYAGRTKARSAYDAKEITVNFNRRGSGSKASGFKSERDKVVAAARAAGLTSQVFGEGRLFFNATVQAIATTFKNFKNPDGTLNKKYISRWAGMYALPPFAFGMLLPYINMALAAMLGGDDDDPYANLPDWVRRKNLCIYIGNDNFITIPVGQELSSFLALGDIAASRLYAPNLESADKSINEEIVDALNSFSPVDINTKVTKGGLFSKDWLAEAAGKTFSVLTPVISVASNRSWTGRPIFREDRFDSDKYTPEYQKVYSGTNQVLVDAMKKLHELGGGDDAMRGKLEVNPAIVQYLWEQYTGGPGKMFSNAISLGRDVKDLATEGAAEDFNVRKVEGLKAFVQQGDDRTQYYRTLAKYRKYREDADKLYDAMNGYKKLADTDPTYYLKLEELSKGVDAVRMNIVREAEKELRKINKAANMAEGAERKELRRQYNEAVKEVVDMLDEVSL